ncbi:hypothetical protein PHET_10957 [Paragonimus heterotremus]|uniref:Nucleoporin p58/p45 n=1 Tax=Paragonimus heterotremus TaxID=100268 RepID=A0A8J4SU26_9TREM|nr:hypothetical protein PHET_10957 [Paragonimus heterotremus]
MNLSLLGGSGSTTKYSHAQQSKDSPVCNEILTTVEQFKTFLSEQKKIREELVNLSQEPLIKLKDDLASMMHQVSVVTSGLRRFSAQRDRLKEDILKEEKYVGIAQRNSETGVSGFLENNATTEYFLNKLLEFDVRMRSYKQELEVLEEHVNSHSRSYLSPKELVALLRQMDNEFICLAAQLYSTYEQIKTLKARYLRIHRVSGTNGRNPFAEIEVSSLKLRQLDNTLDSSPFSLSKTATSRTPYGPSPFSFLSTGPAFSLPTQLTGQTSSVVSQPAGLSTGTPFGFIAPTCTGFTPTTTTAFQFNTSAISTNFQKPLFGFGGTVATTVTPMTATATVGALSLAGQSMKTQFPSSGFTGLGGTSSPGESLFGKRLASKPTSLALPKT